MLHVILLLFFVRYCGTVDDNEWTQIGYDEFDTSIIDEAKWDYLTGNGCHLGRDMCGWGNNELEYYTKSPENSYIQNGSLVIEAVEENSNYTSARLITNGKFHWRFGKFQFRAQVPTGQGLLPAIWLLPVNNTHGTWPRSGEIDILEVLGQNTSVAYCSGHLGLAWNDKFSKSTPYINDSTSFSDDFHIFELIWARDQLEWLIDGHRVQVLKASDVKPPFFYPFNEDFYLIINLAVGGNWPKPPNELTKFPATFKIDYVRVYQKNSQ